MLVSTPRGAVPHPRGGRRPRPMSEPSLLPTLLVVVGLLLCVPGAGTAQEPAAAQVDIAELTANVQVPPVLSVEPRGPVRVPLAAAPDGDGSPGDGAVATECAANVDHALAVRRVDVSGVDPSRVELSVDGGSWSSLPADGAVVRDGLAPGRRASCAVVRFRRTGAEGEASGTEDAWVTVRFEVRARPDPS